MFSPPPPSSLAKLKKLKNCSKNLKKGVREKIKLGEKRRILNDSKCGQLFLQSRNKNLF